MGMYKSFALISVVLLAVPLQVSENEFRNYGFGMVKAITNFELTANEGSNSIPVEIVSDRLGPLLHLVGLVLTESYVLVAHCKVKVAKCTQTVS